MNLTSFINSNISIKKRELAIFLVCRGDLFYPLATTLLSLLENSPEFNHDIIIATGGDAYISKNDKHIISQIYSNIHFLEFTDEFIIKNIGGFMNNYFKPSTPLQLLSRYYAFDLLSIYKQIILLDTDVIINKDINEFKSFYGSGVAARKTTWKIKDHIYSVKPNSPIANDYGVNVGVLYIDDTCSLKSQSFIETHKIYAPMEQVGGPEENIISVCLSLNRIQCIELPYNYHSYYTTAKCDDSIVIHSCRRDKFWNSNFLFYAFPKWRDYFNEWKKLGGSGNLNLSEKFYDFPKESWKITSIFVRENRWINFWKTVTKYDLKIYPLELSNRLKRRSFKMYLVGGGVSTLD